MKKLKKWVLILGMTGPAALNLSCSSMILGDLREAAINALSSFAEQATLGILDQAINLNMMER